VTHALGIDVGTTATKAVVIDDDGHIVAQAERRADLRSPHPGWAEEDTGQWWANVCSIAGELPTAAVGAVGVSGMTPCVIALDEHGDALRPSIQQNDARAGAEVRELAAELSDARILERTGSPITQQSAGPTARWLQRHEPDVWSRTSTLLGSYDFIAHRLTGERAVESNWALESGLYDLESRSWAPDICAAAGIDPALLPAVSDSSAVVGEVTREAAAATGLPAGIPVVAGSADHVASAFAAGLCEDGDLLVKLGGAGDILLTTSEAVVDERLYLDFHLVPGKFLPNGCMAASGSLIRWFNEQLAAGATLAELDAEAAGVAAGAEGLVVLPYMLGEKTPINDPDARGVFFGLHLGHTRGHLFRAVLEGIAFGFRHHVDVLRERGLEPRRVRVTNGGAHSALWKQVTADVLGIPLEVPRASGGSALGAAFTAGMGSGMFGSWNEIDRFVEITEIVEPAQDARAGADQSYATFRALYPALKPLFAGEARR
jgi:xylulokinase